MARPLRDAAGHDAQGARAAGGRRGELEGQVVLITGATRGLGYLLAQGFAREGCPLVICARDAAELERARDDLTRRGATVLAVACDVAEHAAVERLVATATRHYGRIDVLVNNAGVITAGPVQDMTLADFQDAMAVMFWGTVYPTLAVLPQMRDRHRGRIVNVTSVGGKVPIPHLLPYAAAKSAAVAFSEGLRAESARDGITVTTIAPGLMRTGSFLNAAFKGQREREFAPFAVLASLPFFSIDARRAAAQIVRATKRGQAERVLGLSASILTRFHGAFPGLTADLLGVINRFLPAPAGDAETVERGMTIYERVRSGTFDALVAGNLRAARALHQYPGPMTDGPAPALKAPQRGGVSGPVPARR